MGNQSRVGSAPMPVWFLTIVCEVRERVVAPALRRSSVMSSSRPVKLTG